MAFLPVTTLAELVFDSCQHTVQNISVSLAGIRSLRLPLAEPCSHRCCCCQHETRFRTLPSQSSCSALLPALPDPPRLATVVPYCPRHNTSSC